MRTPLIADDLPADFLDQVRKLEAVYCRDDNPMRQSGFGGGPSRWRAEREPILDAVNRNGDFVDIGCANGYLLECLVAWAAERGRALIPHGIDLGARLIEIARGRLPQFAGNLHIADAWTWEPSRTYRFVYTICDCVPEPYLAEHCQRLLERAVEPGGRLIVGMYGSRSRNIPPVDLGRVLNDLGFRIAGTSMGGDPAITSFAWIDRN